MSIDTVFESMVNTQTINRQETGFPFRRSNGYYWVKYKGYWMVAYMCDVGVWFLFQNSEKIIKGFDGIFDEIDERKIEKKDE